MTVLAIDRSTDLQSAALSVDGRIIGRTFEGADARSADWPVMVNDFLMENRLGFRNLDRIVVGMGPGSFAGIRGALAFAQGLATGICAKRGNCGDGVPIVYGLPSAAALAQADGLTAVVGDARRGQLWVVVYAGAETVAPFRLAARDDVLTAVPHDAAVVTPDGARIGGFLSETFGARFIGGRHPLAERLAWLAANHPETTVPEPLPIYLSPAVRTEEPICR